MPPTTLVTIPLQIVIQLIVPGNIESGNTTQGPPLLYQTPELPEGYTPFPDVGMAYKYYNTSKVAWNMARKVCAEDGANLAVIDSYKKNYYATGFQEVGSYCGTWVGIHRTLDGVEWLSVKNDSPPKMIPWAPENTGADEEENKCIVLYGTGDGAVAKPCHYGYCFVCEIEIPHFSEPTQELMAH